MKIGILTFQRANNYGGCLQSYALQHTLTKLGADCEVIDLKGSVLSLPLDDHRGLAQRVKTFIVRTGAKVVKGAANHSFDVFRRKHIRYSPPMDADRLRDAAPQYDMFVSGSDQVWNCNIADNVDVYLQTFFDDPAIRRVSYAASFGFSDLPAARQDSYRRALEKFDRISVRETDGAKIVRELTGRDPQITLDPTLLMDREEWDALAEPLHLKGDYIFVYQLGLSPRLLAFTRALAKKTGLKLVFVPFPVGQPIPGRWYPTISPAKWVWLVKNARYVVTNSFHGLAFSLLFGRQFYVEVSKDLSNLASRITHLLDVAGLPQRLVSDDDFDAVLAQPDIDHSQVEPRLAAARETSMDYLRSLLTKEG